MTPAQRDKIAAALLQGEWAANHDNSGGACPCCMNFQHQGHAKDCDVAEALALLAEESAGEGEAVRLLREQVTRPLAVDAEHFLERYSPWRKRALDFLATLDADDSGRGKK